jgi:DNA repair protein RecO (recombination protein O)
MSIFFSATGIVLSKREHKEVDRWYAMYTREFGKIEFCARGGQKILAKITPHLETIGEVRAFFVQGRQYPTISGAECQHVFPRFREDYQKMLLAQNAFALMDMGTRPQEADPVLYDVLHHWLLFLNEAPTISSERGAYLLGSFTLKLLSLLGYRPELYRCLQCREPIEAGRFFWHALKGGVICATCKEHFPDQYFSARVMEETAMKLVRFALGESFTDQLRPPLPGGALLAFHEIVESLLISHFPVIPANSLRAACV